MAIENNQLGDKRVQFKVMFDNKPTIGQFQRNIYGLKIFHKMIQFDLAVKF